MDCNDRSVVDTVDYPEIQMISDEAQRTIDEQGNVLKPVEDSDSARCDNCLKSEAELASGVILKRCKDCGIALYCGRECQRNAWPTHKSLCKEHVMNRNLTGMNLKNKEDHPDDLQGDISDEEYRKNRKYPPIHYSKRCGGCLKTQRQLPPGMTLRDCQSCKTMQYCGHECQKRDWPHHKPVCQTNSFARKQECDYPGMIDDLMKFANTFKCELVDGACSCLELQANPDAWKTHIFEICFRYLPWREKPVNRFDIRFYQGRKISELHEPELERLIHYPEMEHLIKTSNRPVLRIVMRAGPYNARKKTVSLLQEYAVDPDLGRWNPNWERDFTGSIKLVQAGAPRLRTSPDALDPRYKKKSKHYAPKD
ncbi:hypothetical protein B0H14DRAFT_1537509 [Mycena olivaceomarginata]|nr:hypothetical protein B0H14DRAFT_1537509 [Mycena olivaceomarginata]